MSPVDVVLRPGKGNRSSDAPLLGVLDIVIDGVNITARAGRTQGLTLLAELAHCLTSLCRGRTTRATAHLCTEGETWELGLEVDGSDLLLSVFRAGPSPEVAVHERRVALSELREALTRSLDAALDGPLPTGHRSILEAASAHLSSAHLTAKPLTRGLAQDRVAVRIPEQVEFIASASFRVGRTDESEVDLRVERADLHALLLPGHFTARQGHRSVQLQGVQLFLLAERLVWLAEDALDSWQAARPLFRRLQVEGVRLGIRRGPGDAPVSLTLAQGTPRVEKEGQQLVLRDIDAIDFVELVAQYAEALCERFIHYDARQSANLRLNVLLESARVLRERLSELRLEDSLTNDERESYKSYGLPSVAPRTDGIWSQAGTMRFVPRWVAAVPNVDLKSTFLYDDCLVVGSSREVACLSPQGGEILWRAQSDRAATLPTPQGLARLVADGRLRMHDLTTGAVRWVTRIQPRAGGGAAGALVNTPGLPQLLLLAEGDRAIVAIDLRSGEVRWRHSATRPALFRLRRAGRLVLMSGGDSALTALDVTSGEVVWRVRDRLPFSGDIAIQGDSAFALSSSSVGAARLHHLDLWSGKSHWSTYVDEQPLFGTQPMLCGGQVIVPTRDRRGTGLLAFDQDHGEPTWAHDPGLTAAGSSFLTLEDCIVANSAAGTVLCLEGNTGHVRYNHVFSRPVEGDQPRRLDPVIQNGALFVPQHQVQVLRPATGEIIGEVPCDLVPDLMRVDASCNVYIAEESGHIAAYGVAPRLTVVGS